MSRRAPLFALVAVLVGAAWPASIASAEGPTQRRVAIGQLRGAGRAPFEAALEEALAGDGGVLVPRSEVQAAVRRYGRSRWVRVMSEVDADALLVGRIARSSRGVRIDAQALIRGRRARRIRAQARDPEALAAEVVEQLEALLPSDPTGSGETRAEAPEPADEPETSSARPAVANEAEAAEPEDDRDAPPSPPSPARPRGTIFESFVAAGTLTRRLVYTDDLFDRLASYSLGAAPTLEVGGRLHPFASLDVPFLRDLGVEVGASVSRVQGSERDGAFTHPTITHAFWFAGRYRLRLGPHQLSASVGMARRSFELGPSGPANPMNDPLSGVPGAGYRMVMLELASRLAFGSRVRIEGALRYLIVRDAGGMTSALWFPRATVRSFGARLALDVRLTDSLFLTGRVAVERHAFAMHPRRGDRLIAGGAVDLYVSPTIGALVQY
jgi:hypothetical protein